MSACSTGPTPRGSASNRCRTRSPSRMNGDAAGRACRQERGAPGPPGARISPLWRRRRRLAKTKRRRGRLRRGRARRRLSLCLRSRRRHQCRPHRQVGGRGLARGLGLREGVSRSRRRTIPIYHAPKEVTLDLFKSFTTGIELVRDQKLGKPLGASAAEAKPKLAAFWRSGLTFANAAGNLEGVRALFAKAASPRWWRRIAGRRELDPVRPRSRHRGLARHRSADGRGSGRTTICAPRSRRCASR